MLKFTSDALDKLGVTSFVAVVKDKLDFQSFISWLIDTQRSTSKLLQPLTYIHLLTIIRKTVNAKELVANKSLIVTQVIGIAKD
jgi:hypothetical protein